MRALRSILAGLAVLLVLLLAAAWFGPAMLDWGRYRVAIASLASTALGRPVRIDGEVSLRLLPEPTLTAARITVQDLGQDLGQDPGDAGALSARELRLRVALGPLLAGRIDARELVLDQPELHLHWPPASGLPVAGSLPGRPRWLIHLAARIEDGTLTLGTVTIRHVTATLATDPDTHALMAAGEAQMFGLPWRFTARLGQPDHDGTAALQATLDGEGAVRDTGGRFSGAVAPDGSLAGQISGRGPDLAQVLPAPAVPWRAEGRLTVAGGLAAADELALEIAGSPARGAVALRVAPMPRLDVALAASRLDLDAWLPVLLHGTSGGLETGIDLSAEAATLAGGTLRALRGAFDLGPGGVVVRDASAILPGEASLQLSGAFPDPAAVTAPQPPFRGRAAINLPDMRATLHWLAAAHLGVPDGLPPDVARSGALAAAVTLDRQSASLSDISGTIDGMALGGQAKLAFGAAPSLAASLQLDRLELDPWLPAGGVNMAAITQFAAGRDAQVHVQVAQLRWRGVVADAVTLDAATAAGGLAVHALTGTVAGLHLAMSADVSQAGRISGARLDLAADQADPLAGLVRRVVAAGGGDPGRVPAPLFHGPVRLQAQASGPPGALGGTIGLELADAQVIAQPVIDLATGAWSATVTLRHPGASRLLHMAGLDAAAAWLGEGSLSLLGQVSGGPGRLAADQFDVTAGGLRASGQLLLTTSGAAPMVSGHVDAETLPLPLPSGRGAESFPFDRLRGWRADVQLAAASVLDDGQTLLTDASAHCVLAGGRLRVEHLAAKLAQGSLAATAGIDAAATPPAVTLQGQVTDVSAGRGVLGTPLDLQDGRLDATFDLHAQGFGPSAMLATLGGTARLTARDGRLAGFDAPGAVRALGDAALGGAAPGGAALTRVRAALAGGATAFTRLDAPMTLAQGVATLNGATIAAQGISATVSGTMDLTAPSVDLLARVAPLLPGAPELRLQLIGPLGSPTHVADLSALSDWLAVQR